MNTFAVLFFEDQVLVKLLRVEASSRIGALIKAARMLMEVEVVVITSYEVHPARG